MVSRVIPVDDFDLVIFGATGDLSHRKILPGLFRRFVAGQIPPSARIIGAARTAMDDAQFRREAADAICEFGKVDREDPCLPKFLELLGYVPIDAKGEGGWQDLKSRLRDGVIRAFYFSVAPSLFGDLAERLSRHGMTDPHSRVVVEKPFGRDLESARALNHAGPAFR